MCKIHLRWYMTPVRFYHIKLDASRFCWRMCSAPCTQLHMWWQCPITSSFWFEVAQLLSEVLKYRVDLSSELAVLDIHLKSCSRPLRAVMQHILVSAWFVIVQHWNSADPLKIAEVIRHCHCETKLTSPPSHCKLLYSLWEP